MLYASLALSSGCLYNDDPNIPPDRALTSLEVTPAIALADGSTSIRITATVPLGRPEDRPSVKFTTTAGVFTESGTRELTLPAINGTATAFLRAPTSPSLARLRVSVDPDILTDSVTFSVARPQSITVEPSTFAVPAGIQNEVRISAQLRRSGGVVSRGTPVSFSAVMAGTTTPIGQFGLPSTSDSTSTASVRFSAGNTPFRGTVRIIAETQGDNGPIRGEAPLEIIDEPEDDQ
jgi:hypothetical protein